MPDSQAESSWDMNMTRRKATCQDLPTGEEASGKLETLRASAFFFFGTRFENLVTKMMKK